MSLVVDTLKNPCLDYVQHIIFSTAAATFAAGGTTFSSFGDVRGAPAPFLPPPLGGVTPPSASHGGVPPPLPSLVAGA